MSKQEYVHSNSNGYVAPVTADMAPAQLDETERQAKANVVKARSENANADAAGKTMNAGNSEATVYGNIAMDILAPGAKILMNVADFADTRREDLKERGHVAHHTHAKPKTMDEHILGGMSRAPGVYRESVGEVAYGAPSAPRKKSHAGEDLMMRSNIASSSLKEQGKGAIGSWAVEDPKMDSVKQAKKLTFTNELNNKAALDNVQAARMEQQVMLQRVNQMAPGMGMANGPSMKAADLIKMAEREQEMNRWRESSS